MQSSIDVSRDRRTSPSARIPVDLLVELCALEERGAPRERPLDSWDDVSEAFTDTYDADGLDLSATGLRVRSAVLPDVGQRLRCRFDLPETDERCEAEGRVVWSNDVGRHGEFGLRFEALAPTVQAALARWAMERAPSTLPGRDATTTSPALAEAPRGDAQRNRADAFGLARVRFDGVASAIEAEVTLRDELRLDVEQALPFFELGRLATVDADGSSERRRLEHVSLRIDGGVPRLVLGFVAAPSSSAGTIEAPSEPSREAMPSAEATLQDAAIDALLAGADEEDDEHEERVVEARTRQTPASAAWVTEGGDPDAEADRGPVARARAAEAPGRSKRALFGSAEDSIEEVDPRTQALRKKKLDEVRRVLLDGEELPEVPPSSAGSEEAAVVAPVAKVTERMRALASAAAPALVRARNALAHAWAAIVLSAGPKARAAWAAIGSWVARARSVALASLEARAPRLRALFARGVKEKRRSTAPAPVVQSPSPASPRRQQRGVAASPDAAPAQLASRPRIPLRWVLLFVVATAAVFALAYASAGGASEPPPIVVPMEEPSTGAAEESPRAPAPSALAPVTASSPATPSAEAPPLETEPAAALAPSLPATAAEPSALAAPSTDEGRLPMPGYPTIGRGQPAPSEVAAGAPAPAPAAAPAPARGGRAFGSERVEGGRTTSIRMSPAPTSLEGQADAHGFTVTIRGAQSLDRVAAMARNYPAIDRASILNRGDHAVLDIRFVEGRSPAYRVQISGESVDVTIGR